MGFNSGFKGLMWWQISHREIQLMSNHKIKAKQKDNENKSDKVAEIIAVVAIYYHFNYLVSLVCWIQNSNKINMLRTSCGYLAHDYRT